MGLRSFFRKKVVPSKTSITVKGSTSENSGEINKEKDKNQITKFDSEGVPYKDCQQCEGKMYKQGNMWVCDLLGNSFEE